MTAESLGRKSFHVKRVSQSRGDSTVRTWLESSTMIAHHQPDLVRVRLLIALASLVGLILRVWPVGQLGFDQFDEGIYGLASAWIFDPQGLAGLDPALISYAPPGYVILSGMTAWLLGFSDQPPLLVSALLGAATIPVIARLGWILVGPKAGLISAWSVCFAGPHIAFSRMGLTDSSFLFFWSLALVAAVRFLEKPGLSRALGLGILVGFEPTVQIQRLARGRGGFAFICPGNPPGQTSSRRSLASFSGVGGGGRACGLVSGLALVSLRGQPRWIWGLVATPAQLPARLGFLGTKSRGPVESGRGVGWACRDDDCAGLRHRFQRRRDQLAR